MFSFYQFLFQHLYGDTACGSEARGSRLLVRSLCWDNDSSKQFQGCLNHSLGGMVKGLMGILSFKEADGVSFVLPSHRLCHPQLKFCPLGLWLCPSGFFLGALQSHFISQCHLHLIAFGHRPICLPFLDLGFLRKRNLASFIFPYLLAVKIYNTKQGGWHVCFTSVCFTVCLGGNSSLGPWAQHLCSKHEGLCRPVLNGSPQRLGEKL